MHYRSSFGLFAACALFAAPSAFAADGDVGGEGSTPDQIAAAYDPTADDQAGADAYATGNYAAAAKACRKIVAAVDAAGGAEEPLAPPVAELPAAPVPAGSARQLPAGPGSAAGDAADVVDAVVVTEEGEGR